MAKPSSTGMPVEKIFAAYEEMDDARYLFRRAQMTFVLLDLFERKKITDIEMIVADLFNYSNAIEGGYVSIDEINTIMELRKDVQSIRVPYWYLKVLTDGFRRHAAGGSGVSLGEAMRLEGGGQGSQKRIEKIQNIIRDLEVCELVLLIRAQCEISDNPISLEKAYAEAASRCEADGFDASEEVIRRAYQRYNGLIQAAKAELLIGGATS